MTTEKTLNCEQLRKAFEGREAIYTEQGVLRVRVFNIRCNINARQINAEVEEIPTTGLERSLFHRRSNGPSPLRWKISAGQLTSFSEHIWQMGYGGWSLYFAPDVVSSLVAIAASWPAELDEFEKYNQALRFVSRQSINAQSKNLFSDSTEPLRS